ncbi:MAG: crosslink repair DNA glycosylase YcaQ family protein [Microbacterium sp.]
MHRLTREDARRIAVHAQLLTASRPSSIAETVHGLTIVNIDQTAAVAPSASHILWSRIGSAFQPSDLTRAVQDERDLFEWGGFYRLMSDLPLLRHEMAARPDSAQAREWLIANARFRADVMARLRAEGPLHAAAIDDTAEVSWASSGWTDNRNTSKMLDLLTLTGDVAVWGRDGRGRLFDVADRVYPSDLPDIPVAEAAHERSERRLGALGIARATSVSQPFEPIDVGTIGEEAVIDGVDGTWRVDAAVLESVASGAFEPRTALLSPHDRLVFDRKRLEELFEFEYVLEMYKPAARRRWGYFAVPILDGDRLVGKLDARADRRAGVLRVNAVHEDAPFDAETAAAVDDEIRDLATWLGLEVAGLSSP